MQFFSRYGFIQNFSMIIQVNVTPKLIIYTDEKSDLLLRCVQNPEDYTLNIKRKRLKNKFMNIF